jgi:hypothetical protein
MQVCSSCYDLFNAEKHLAAVESRFARALGIDMKVNDIGVKKKGKRIERKKKRGKECYK